MKNALKHKQDMKKIQASSLDSGKVSAAITQQRPLQRLPSNGLCSDYPATARTSSEID